MLEKAKRHPRRPANLSAKRWTTSAKASTEPLDQAGHRHRFVQGTPRRGEAGGSQSGKDLGAHSLTGKARLAKRGEQKKVWTVGPPIACDHRCPQARGERCWIATQHFPPRSKRSPQAQQKFPSPGRDESGPDERKDRPQTRRAEGRQDAARQSCITREKNNPSSKGWGSTTLTGKLLWAAIARRYRTQRQ
jgi:hypothetical protein